MSDTTAMSAVQANQYDLLLESINQSLLHGREQIASAVSQTILRTYWEIGRNIVEFEQQGQAKAERGLVKATFFLCGASTCSIQNSRRCLEF